MQVIDIMTANPVTIGGDRTLKEALDLMGEHHCKHLPVLSKQRHLIGVLSDRDCRHALNSPYILRERWQDDALLNQLEVRSMMAVAPIIIEPDARASEAARLMLAHDIGCLPVMRGETLVGIVTRSDVLLAFVNADARQQRLERDEASNNGRPS